MMFKAYRARKQAEREERARQARIAQHRAWWEFFNVMKGGEPIPFDEEMFR